MKTKLTLLLLICLAIGACSKPEKKLKQGYIDSTMQVYRDTSYITNLYAVHAKAKKTGYKNKDLHVFGGDFNTGTGSAKPGTYANMLAKALGSADVNIGIPGETLNHKKCDTLVDGIKDIMNYNAEFSNVSLNGLKDSVCKPVTEADIIRTVTGRWMEDTVKKVGDTSRYLFSNALGKAYLTDTLYHIPDSVHFSPDTIPVYFKELAVIKYEDYKPVKLGYNNAVQVFGDSVLYERWNKGFVVWQTYYKPSTSKDLGWDIVEGQNNRILYYGLPYNFTRSMPGKFLYSDKTPVDDKAVIISVIKRNINNRY